MPYFVDYGTALGSWRGGTVLYGDDDADIGVLAEDYARAAAALRYTLPSWLEVCLQPREDISGVAAAARQIAVRRARAPGAAGGRCSDKPNVDVYPYARAGGSLERADLVDRRGPHYGAAGAAVLLPTSCACLGGRAFRAPADLEAYLSLRYGCVGAIGLECEPDPAFGGRGTRYRQIDSFPDFGRELRSMRAHGAMAP